MKSYYSTACNVLFVLAQTLFMFAMNILMALIGMAHKGANPAHNLLQASAGLTGCTSVYPTYMLTAENP